MVRFSSNGSTSPGMKKSIISLCPKLKGKMFDFIFYYAKLVYSWLWPPAVDRELNIIHTTRPVRRFRMLPSPVPFPKLVVHEPPSDIDEGEESASGWEGGDESSSSNMSLSPRFPPKPPKCPKSPQNVPIPRRMSRMRNFCPPQKKRF